MNETTTEPRGKAPFASVHKSTDPTWGRWGVSARNQQTEWLHDEAAAVAKANRLCREAGTITWTEYEASRALKRQQIEALPELIAAAKAFLAAYRQSPTEPTLDICRAANLTAEALEKAGAK